MNYSILEQNLLASFENEEAKGAFLRAKEHPQNDQYSYFAESVAREVDDLSRVLKPAIGAAAKPFEANNDVQSDLLAFILKRHWHSRVTRADG